MHILRVFTDEQGNYGWGKDTQLGLFLTSKRVSKLEDLKGKEVTVQITEKGFLTFI